ncbi:MAG: hypothetical protein QGH40_16905 [bacterium]|nr:hypothetical protein [bacterium]
MEASDTVAPKEELNPEADGKRPPPFRIGMERRELTMNFNPFDMSRQMMKEFEQGFSEYMEKTMRDPYFMKMVAKNMNASLDYQSMLKKHIATVLKTLGMPDEDSMSSLYQTVHNLETRLLDMEEQFEDLVEIVGRLATGQKAVAELQTQLVGLKDRLEKNAAAARGSAPVKAAVKKKTPAKKTTAAKKPAAKKKAPAKKKPSAKKPAAKKKSTTR